MSAYQSVWLVIDDCLILTQTYTTLGADYSACKGSGRGGHQA